MAVFYIEATPQKRTILAILNGAEYPDMAFDYNYIHLTAEMVLNYYGFNVRYHDLRNGIPSDQDLEDVYAIFTWFQVDGIPYASEYIPWAKKQVQSGIRYIIFGLLGFARDSSLGKDLSYSEINSLFNEIGLDYQGDWKNNPLTIEIAYKNPDMMDFEINNDAFVAVYERVISINPENQVFLKLQEHNEEDSLSDVGVITPNGGYVLSQYEVYHEDTSDRYRWIINPFRFFAEALGIQGRPVYDTTTLFGRRIFYSHIDGDGYLNRSMIDNQFYSSHFIFENVLSKYDLPISVSFISSELFVNYFGLPEMNDFAKRIAALDNIELGTHGFSHPLDWDRKITAFVIKNYSVKLKTPREMAILSESDYAEGAFVEVDMPTYLHRETVGAIDDMNQIIGKAVGKKVQLYQWTGDCKPPALAIAYLDEIDMPNINGGDSRFDTSCPSYTCVKPLFRQIDGKYQVYASNANENIYTDSWSGPFYAFKFVIETFKQTERPTLVKAPPRRVSPINVYYHYYSGERTASLEAVIDVYNYALTQDIIPIFTSDYIRIANSYRNAKIETLSSNGYQFSNYGSCQTIRFEGKVYPDLKRSRNIWGYHIWEGYTYIHLGNKDSAVLYLNENPPTQPYLDESSVVIKNLTFQRKQISFQGKGYGMAMIQFNNMPANKAYKLKQTFPSGKTRIYTKQSHSNGSLRLIFDGKGQWKMELIQS